ncbi:MAG: RHS repeat-associated core domain-containing protein [Theionarchaea archaeon]|nr:RHS repeat-associated core domain-containing protein [Theionarchaea archaeon]
MVVVGTYEPFGESTVTGEESYLFTGKEMDETGLYYFNARYYDPDLGRFITRDPLAGEEANPQSLSLYTYCVNNPLKLTDPTELFYKMCLENGNCLGIWENGPKRGQWIAKDAEGNTITDSEQIDSLLNAGQILEAMVLVLQFFGFDVDMDDIHYSNYWKDENGNVDYEKIKDHMGGERSLGYIEFEQDGKTIRIDVKIFGGFFGSSGHISWDQENNKITMTFYLANKINANEFLHIVGHECIHLNQYLTGQYTEWINIYGPAGAQAMAEVAAYHWNVRLNFFRVTYQHTIWVSSLEHHQKMYKRWLTIFFKRIK